MTVNLMNAQKQTSPTFPNNDTDLPVEPERYYIMNSL